MIWTFLVCTTLPFVLALSPFRQCCYKLLRSWTECGPGERRRVSSCPRRSFACLRYFPGSVRKTSGTIWSDHRFKQSSLGKESSCLNWFPASFVRINRCSVGSDGNQSSDDPIFPSTSSASRFLFVLLLLTLLASSLQLAQTSHSDQDGDRSNCLLRQPRKDYSKPRPLLLPLSSLLLLPFPLVIS